MKCPHCGEDAFNPSAKDGDTVPCVHCGGLFLYQSPYAPPKTTTYRIPTKKKRKSAGHFLMFGIAGGGVLAILLAIAYGVVTAGEFGVAGFLLSAIGSFIFFWAPLCLILGAIGGAIAYALA